jgi:hypothetical protein
MKVVIDGARDYAHPSSQYVQDNATPSAVSSGLRASRLDSSKLRDNRPNRLPDLRICPPDLVGAVTLLCKEVTRWAH